MKESGCEGKKKGAKQSQARPVAVWEQLFVSLTLINGMLTRLRTDMIGTRPPLLVLPLFSFVLWGGGRAHIGYTDEFGMTEHSILYSNV